MIENFNPFISLGGDNQKVNHMAEAALEMNLTCNDLKKDLNLTDGDVVDMLQLVMDRFKNSNCCLLYTSPSPRDEALSRMPSSA